MAGNDSVSCWFEFIIVGSCDIAILNSNTFLSEWHCCTQEIMIIFFFCCSCLFVRIILEWASLVSSLCQSERFFFFVEYFGCCCCCCSCHCCNLCFNITFAMIVTEWNFCIYSTIKQIKYQRQIVESLTMLLLMPFVVVVDAFFPSFFLSLSIYIVCFICHRILVTW